MATPVFTDLDQIFQMFSPADLVGTTQPNLGGPLEKVNNPFVQLLALLENNGRGVLTVADMITNINQLKTNAQLGSVDLSKFLSIWTDQTVANLGPSTASDQLALDPTGKQITVANLAQVIGADFPIPTNDRTVPASVAVIVSRSPFFNPSTRNTKNAEIFLNSMPSTVLSQLVPYLQVEFQFNRDPSNQIQTLGQLKFLVGAADATKLSPADRAIYEGHQVIGDTDKTVQQLDFAGMEMFTSPQTMVNPQPNQSVGTNGMRYADIIDPFRPFATLEHVTISSKPSGAGFYCYKKANMAIKVHDRSRLSEISDLMRPRVYTGVTIWVTYGWRAPVRGTQDQNPYFAYVNDNMLMREAYHIVNSNFTFDQIGQVTINLELFTKGVAEMRELKITSHDQDAEFTMSEIRSLGEKISAYRQKLRLDPPEGPSKEIRVFQILEAAEIGEFLPNVSLKDVRASIDALKKSLLSQSSLDKDAVNGLYSALSQLYAAQPKNPTKFVEKERYETRVTDTVNKMFAEVRTGPDPWLAISGKTNLPPELIKICEQQNKVSSQASAKVFEKQIVSFGKLFSVFALRSLLSIPGAVEETQVFFYNLNESCGPISTCSIAEFPIDIKKFIDDFHDLAKTKGGEKITLEDFLALAINSQFLDNRAWGYGLRDLYDPKTGNQKTGPNEEQKFESRLAAMTSQYGPFRKPVVEMYVEMSHRKVNEAGESDVLQLLNYSAKDASTVSLQDAKGNATRKILRIHVYDKQTNAYKAASQLLRNENNTGFINTNLGLSDIAKQKVAAPGSTLAQIKAAIGAGIQEDVSDGRLQITDLSSFKSNQQIKDVVSKLVPTIRFGANGTTITAANLASKAEPLLSTVQMIRSQTVKNNAAPNGSGDLGIPQRVIPAQLTMSTLGNPLATMAQTYFIDFQTGTTLDNLYIVTGLNHTFAPGKFETQWTFGYCDGYGIFEGAPNIVDGVIKLTAAGAGAPSK